MMVLVEDNDNLPCKVPSTFTRTNTAVVSSTPTLVVLKLQGYGSNVHRCNISIPSNSGRDLSLSSNCKK